MTETAATWSCLSPPGETIEDLLEERSMSQADLATRMGFTKKHVNDMIRGRAVITPDAALRLEAALGSTAGFWLRRESQYREALARKEEIARLRDDASWLDSLPLGHMVKHGWVRKLKDKGEQVAECLRFFGVHDVAAYDAAYTNRVVAFRASTKSASRPGAVAAWLRAGELRATKIDTQPFDKERFFSTLTEIRALTSEPDPASFIPKLREASARCGVAVAFLPAPPGCPISGATFWQRADKAVLLLSLRYRSNDHLWFTFFHEAGHLVLHGKKMLFVELDDGADDEREKQADRFARDHLIPPAAARELPGLAPTRPSVRSFAERIGVAPGIVVGRMQHDGLLPWSHLNVLKVRYKWRRDVA